MADLFHAMQHPCAEMAWPPAAVGRSDASLLARIVSLAIAGGLDVLTYPRHGLRASRLAALAGVLATLLALIVSSGVGVLLLVKAAL